jgi:hypothetical protein
MSCIYWSIVNHTYAKCQSQMNIKDHKGQEPCNYLASIIEQEEGVQTIAILVNGETTFHQSACLSLKMQIMNLCLH